MSADREKTSISGQGLLIPITIDFAPDAGKTGQGSPAKRVLLALDEWVLDNDTRIVLTVAEVLG